MKLLLLSIAFLLSPFIYCSFIIYHSFIIIFHIQLLLIFTFFWHRLQFFLFFTELFSYFFPIFSYFFSKADSSALDIDTLGAQIRAQLASVIANRVFCENVVNNVLKYNVSTLQIPSQIAAINAICGATALQNVHMLSLFIPYQAEPTGQPSSQPTVLSTEPPPVHTHTITIVFICIIIIIIMIACLRCCIIVVACCSKPKVKEHSHLYDILVILNDDEEAIFENVRHEDIVFSRR